MSRNIAPGYCVVEQPGTLDFQARMLFRDPHSPAARLFMQNNADTPWLKPGQIMIVVDPDSSPTLQVLYMLRQEKQKANNVFTDLNTEEASFMLRHYGMISGLTQAGDQIFGTVGDVGEKYFSAIEHTLRKIESTYQNQYRTQGMLISQQFFIERNRLLNQLKALVNKPLIKSFVRYAIKFRPYEDMRRALNLSSRSIIHEWSTAGIGGIPGYADYVGNAAKAARFLKRGGYIGIGFAFAGTTNDVINACTIGREGECEEIAFKEYTTFSITTGAGIVAGAYGGSAMLGICAAVGIATAGAGGVACAAIGSIAAGYAGSVVAEKLANKILE